MTSCKSIGCTNFTDSNSDFCDTCSSTARQLFQPNQENMAAKYPKYYKDIGAFSAIDVYAVHHLFNIQDPSGCIQHASKKLLLSGVRTGGKSAYKDIEEARDTLTRWLQINEPVS